MDASRLQWVDHTSASFFQPWQYWYYPLARKTPSFEGVAAKPCKESEKVNLNWWCNRVYFHKWCQQPEFLNDLTQTEWNSSDVSIGTKLVGLLQPEPSSCNFLSNSHVVPKLLLDLQAFAIMNNLVKLMQESFQMCHECDPTKAHCSEVAMLPAMADCHGQVPWQKSLEIVWFFRIFT